MADQSNIQSSASKSIRPFRSSEEYLYAMKEDLAEWLKALYDLDVSADTFLDALESGCALCRHANNVNRAARDFQLEYPETARRMTIPAKDVVFQCRNVVPGSFLARDNVSNFIQWCRHELRVKDVLMFETNDLVERCNEKNFVLCLLEVARRGAKFGMPAPMLIQLEEEIEEEIRDQESLRAEERSPSRRCSRRENRESPEDEDEQVEEGEEQEEPEEEVQPHVWPQKRVLCDMRNLDELVREILGQCSCPAQFPMIKVSEGKYKVGDSSALIFIRVLRTHVMVRVGGGWDTLEHYLDKHDPCRCAAYAHRYHQAKASGQSQGAQSKSSSAHSSRSTSPGPHWRNEGISTYKPNDRRSLEPPSAPGVSSSSSTRPGRSRNAAVRTEVDTGGGRTLLPQPPRDRSEPRHVNPLKSKEIMTRRLSGGSDSSTESSKGGGGGGGARQSLGGPSRRSGEQVVLLVNRKEGKHVIDRAVVGNQTPPTRSSTPRARSQSRERSSLPTSLKPNPPTGSSDGSRTSRTDRGRSVGNEGQRRLHVPRSHSQSKLSGSTLSNDGSPAHSSSPRTSQRLPSDKQVDLPKQASSPRPDVGFSKKQSFSCTNSPVKRVQSTNSNPIKKTVTTPRTQVPCSPSTGKGKLLPPVNSGGRRPPHSSPRNSNNCATRSPRLSLAPRSAERGQPKNISHLENQETGEDKVNYQILPPFDPEKEQDLFRSFEAEFLANTQQVREDLAGKSVGRATLQVADALTEPFLSDSASSSSNSSTSSINVGAKIGTLPYLKETRRTIPRHFQPEDPLNILYGHNLGERDGFGQAEREHWGERKGGFKKLPAISSVVDKKEAPSSLPGLRCTDSEQMNHFPSQPAVDSTNMNGERKCSPTDGLLDQQCHLGLKSMTEGDVLLENHQPNLFYDLENGDSSDNLLPPEGCPSPVPLARSEDCSFQDTSSENSLMSFSLSESRSGSPSPSSKITNGENGQSGEVTISEHKLGVKSRPRVDDRLQNTPSRIPTPVRQKNVHTNKTLSPCNTPPLSRRTSHPASCNNLLQSFTDMIHPQSHPPAVGNKACSYPAQGNLDTGAIAQN